MTVAEAFTRNDEIHRVAMLALLDDLGILPDGLHFHEVNHPFQLLVRKLSENLDSSQRSGTQPGLPPSDLTHRVPPP